MQLKTYIEEILVGALSHSSLASVLLASVDDLNAENAKPNYSKALGKIVTAINMGLAQIYTELPLAQEEIFLQTNSAMDRYLLTAKHAEFAGKDMAGDKWIVDTVYSPFRDNIIECLYVADEFGGRLYTNDAAATWNVNFPKPNVIQVPFADADVTLSITYKAGHPKIPFSSTKQLVQEDTSLGYTLPDMELELPHYLYNALTLFITSKYFSSIGSVEANAQGQAHYAEFMNAIQTVKNGQLIHGDYTEIDNLSNQGWV